MKTKLSKLERAYVVFYGRLYNLLLGKGAVRLDENEYAMRTPVGPIRLTIRPDRVVAQFASVYGGALAIAVSGDGGGNYGLDINTGEWEIPVTKSAGVLCDPDTIDRIAAQLDRVLHHKPTPAQSTSIVDDLKDEYETSGKYARFIGQAFVRGWLQHLGTDDATADARKPRRPTKKPAARKLAAKHARPKRRGRV